MEWNIKETPVYSRLITLIQREEYRNDDYLPGRSLACQSKINHFFIKDIFVMFLWRIIERWQQAPATCGWGNKNRALIKFTCPTPEQQQLRNPIDEQRHGVYGSAYKLKSKWSCNKMMSFLASNRIKLIIEKILTQERMFITGSLWNCVDVHNLVGCGAVFSSGGGNN